MERADVFIAKVLGEPIDPNQRVPVELAAICNIETAAPGETVKAFSPLDDDTDDVYEVTADGSIAVHKVTPTQPANLAFVALNSKLEYVLVNEILNGLNGQGNEVDTAALARKKAAITRAMDKEEVRRILNACLSLVEQEVTKEVGEDLYDVIVKMVHKLEDYGDNYVLLVGSQVKEKIDLYDKENAGNFNYRIGIKEYLAAAGIELIKVVGKIKVGSVSERVLATNKAVLVAKDSTIAQGKPITFVRRLVSPEIAAQMGAQVDAAQRALISVPTPVIIAGTNTLGFAVYGVESIAQVILNGRAIAWSDTIIA